MKKLPEMAPNWATKRIFPTKPDFANYLGDTDFDFDNFNFGILWILNFWIPKFLDCLNSNRAGEAGGRLGGRAEKTA